MRTLQNAVFITFLFVSQVAFAFDTPQEAETAYFQTNDPNRKVQIIHEIRSKFNTISLNPRREGTLDRERVFRDAIANGSFEVALAAVVAVGNVWSEPALKLLIAATRHSSATVRIEATRRLGEMISEYKNRAETIKLVEYSEWHAIPPTAREAVPEYVLNEYFKLANASDPAVAKLARTFLSKPGFLYECVFSLSVENHRLSPTNPSHVLLKNLAAQIPNFTTELRETYLGSRGLITIGDIEFIEAVLDPTPERLENLSRSYLSGRGGDAVIALLRQRDFMSESFFLNLMQNAHPYQQYGEVQAAIEALEAYEKKIGTEKFRNKMVEMISRPDHKFPGNYIKVSGVKIYAAEWLFQRGQVTPEILVTMMDADMDAVYRQRKSVQGGSVIQGSSTWRERLVAVREAWQASGRYVEYVQIVRSQVLSADYRLSSSPGKMFLYEKADFRGPVQTASHDRGRCAGSGSAVSFIMKFIRRPKRIGPFRILN